MVSAGTAVASGTGDCYRGPVSTAVTAAPFGMFAVADCLVPAVDPDDDSLERHIVRLYTYDPERRERRHKAVAAFSRAKEADALMQKLSDEWRQRAGRGEITDPRDYFSVVVWAPGYQRLQNNARLLRAALRRGVSFERLQDLELPPNIAVVADSDPRAAPRSSA